MVIQTRLMMGGIAAVIVLGAAAWGSYALVPRSGTVEIKALDTRAWSVEVTELGAASVIVDGTKGSSAR